MKNLNSFSVTILVCALVSSLLSGCASPSSGLSLPASNFFKEGLKGPVPQTTQVLAQAQKTISQFAPLYTKVPVNVLTAPHPYESPLLTIPSKPRCNLVVNTTAVAQQGWNFVLPQGNTQAWDSSIEIAVLHELGHCVFYEYSRKTPVGVTEQEKEVFADMFMLNVVSTLEPNARRTQALNALLHSRAVFASIDSVHNTLPRLRALQQELSTRTLQPSEVLAKTFNTFERETGLNLGFADALIKPADLANLKPN